MAERSDPIRIYTPQDFLDGGYSLESLGDIRQVETGSTIARLVDISHERQLGRAGIALLAFRQEDAPGTSVLPERGLLYALHPSPDPDEWRTYRQDFTHVIRAPGQLHAYDRDAVILPS